jgi:propionyl-CoA carboxylase beta chain
MPKAITKSFDMMQLIEAIVDESRVHSYRDNFGTSMLCVFAYLDGYPVGILANQSKRLSGAIDCDAAQKSSRFIRLCDAYNIAVITLIDVPGFMPGKREEHRGLLRQGAKFCFAMQTVVPRLSVIVRKAYGAAAFLMMQTKAQGGDLVLALKESQIGAMGQKANARVKYAEQQDAPEPISTNEFLLKALEKGIIDEVIDGADIRARLSFHLPKLLNKPPKDRLSRKHFIEP